MGTAPESSNTETRDQDPVFVQRVFASIADRYVLTNHVLSLGIDVLWRRRVAKMVSADEPETVLDLATGSGDLAAAIQSACPPETTIIGADFCEPMLHHARDKRGLQNLLVADAMRLPFADGSFDAVTASYGLRNMASWEDALKEMRRVLKPGGMLVILDFSLPAAPVLKTPYRFYLHRILPSIGGFLNRNREAYAYLGESIERFPSGKVMTGLIENCGFAEAECLPLLGGISSIYSGRAITPQS